MQAPNPSAPQPFAVPEVRPLGVDGLLIGLGNAVGAAVSDAVLAMRAAIEAQGWPEVTETAPALVSVLVRFDFDRTTPEALADRILALWHSLPDARRTTAPPARHWRVPAVFGGQDGPDLAEAAQMMGLTPGQAVESLCAQPLRVLAIGFAPGQPYLGHLPPVWDLPRLTRLTPQVPQGAICAAIRQLVLFSRPAPTGWRQLGRAAVRLYRPEAAQPFLLSPGDALRFYPVTAAQLEQIDRSDPLGGLHPEPVA